MDTARELFEHELRDIYDAEHKLVRATLTMSEKVTDQELSLSFKEHSQVTQGQIERLDRMFAAIGRAPRREPCAGINGLIEEFSSFVKEGPQEDVLNSFAIGAAAKVEHYEIQAYKALIVTGTALGIDCTLLEENLAEEQATAAQLEAKASSVAARMPLGGE